MTEAIGVEAKIVPVVQGTLVAIAPDRFNGLAGNFGHTQVFDGQKMVQVIPEFQPQTPLVESWVKNVEWMNQRNPLPNSDEERLEDKIIADVRKLPNQI